ncbi:PAS domain S-box protein [Thiohalorhabdus methylotrophus]|uniref:histidine kinase n=1 Tax=Thiohalorhabdus methylotrophus TaxID=3242694 RepID=A0ABV4TXX2_9GAMM
MTDPSPSVPDQPLAGLLELTPAGTIRRANGDAACLLGADPGCLPGGAFVDYLPADSPLRADLAKMARGEREVARREERISGGPGAAVWVEVSAALLTDAEGAPERISAVLGNTTARRGSEARDYYEEMFRKNTAPKLLIDPETGFIADANPAALAFYGYTIEDIRQRRIQDINQLSEEEVRTEWDKARREERRYFEFRHRLADGGIRDVKVYSGPIEIGGRQYLHSIIHDVTESRRYQQSLERYKALFDTLPVGVYRNEAGSQGYFSEVNPAMARIFGAESPEELLRHPTANLYRDPAERQRFSDDLLDRGAVHQREVALRTLDGRPIWAAITALVQDSGEGDPVFDGIVEDITERKATEQERDRLVAIIESTPDLVGMADGEGRPFYHNPAFRKLLADRVSTGSLPDSVAAFHPAWAQRKLAEEAFPRARETGIWQGETALLGPTGEEVPVSQIVLAHQDETGAVVRYSTIMRDLSPIKEAEHFNRQLLDSLTAGVFGIDVQGRFTFLNAAAVGLFGFQDEAAVLGKDSHALTHHSFPDGSPYPADACPILQVLTTGEPLGAWEDWFWCADGSAFPVEVFAAPMRDAAGNVEGAVVSFQDISERLRAEATRNQLVEVLEATPDFVSFARPDGTILYINQGGRQILGLPPSSGYWGDDVPADVQAGEIAGRWGHPDWAARRISEEGIPTAMAEGYWEGESALLDVEGHEIPMSQVIIAHRSADGEVERLSTIMRDIGDRVRLEEALREERDLVQAILEGLPGVFYLLDKRGNFTRWSRDMELVTGLDSEQLGAAHFTELFGDEDQDRIAEAIGRVFSEGEVTIEAGLRTIDGSYTPYFLSGHRVELGGAPFLTGLGLDISDRVRLESELRATNQALEHSNSELEQFAYAVSHDLQEPLRIINSYLGLLQRRYGDRLDDKAGHYIATTTEAAGRMSRMIQDLLEYSRVKRLGEDMEPVDLDEVLEEALANLQQAREEAGATMEADELPTVSGDQGQLVRLFQNLLSNAFKYRRPGVPSSIAVRLKKRDGAWELSVADNGIGIDPSQAGRVFQVFQRLHTRDEYEGTGAGLALAKRIVERHGGTIWVESAGEGQGSTFRFTLPVAEDAER